MDLLQLPKAVSAEITNGELVGRLVGVDAKLAVELPPGELERLVECPGTVEKPEVEIEAEGAALEGAEDIQVDGDRMLNDFVEKVLAEADRAVPESRLVGALGVPPQVGAVGDQRADACSAAFMVVEEGYLVWKRRSI